MPLCRTLQLILFVRFYIAVQGVLTVLYYLSKTCLHLLNVCYAPFRSKLISIGLLPIDETFTAPLTLMSFLPSPYLLGACRAFRLSLYCGTTHKSVVSVPYPLMKAMQIGKEKVYHKAVNVGFYGSLFHQCASAICLSGLTRTYWVYELSRLIFALRDAECCRL